MPDPRKKHSYLSGQDPDGSIFVGDDPMHILLSESCDATQEESQEEDCFPNDPMTWLQEAYPSG